MILTEDAFTRSLRVLWSPFTNRTVAVVFDPRFTHVIVMEDRGCAGKAVQLACDRVAVAGVRAEILSESHSLASLRATSKHSWMYSLMSFRSRPEMVSVN